MDTQLQKRLVFLDTETTGREERDRIFQVAYEYDGQEHTELFKPPLPLCIEAMEATGYTNKDVEDKKPFAGSVMHKELAALLARDGVILVAHNAPFDTEMLRRDGIEIPASRVIDTLKIARHLDPDAKLGAYRLQYLRYALELEVSDAAAHDALGDVRVLKALFARLYARVLEEAGGVDAALEKMIEISQLPALIRRFSFGKYNGQLIADVAQQDAGYLEWLLGQKEQENAPEQNADWIFTLRQALGRMV